jgi:hypothetical protein
MSASARNPRYAGHAFTCPVCFQMVDVGDRYAFRDRTKVHWRCSPAGRRSQERNRRRNRSTR